jgi:hypothetical protein
MLRDAKRLPRSSYLRVRSVQGIGTTAYHPHRSFIKNLILTFDHFLLAGFQVDQAHNPSGVTAIFLFHPDVCESTTVSNRLDKQHVPFTKCSSPFRGIAKVVYAVSDELCGKVRAPPSFPAATIHGCAILWHEREKTVDHSLGAHDTYANVPSPRHVLTTRLDMRPH